MIYYSAPLYVVEYSYTKFPCNRIEPTNTSLQNEFHIQTALTPPINSEICCNSIWFITWNYTLCLPIITLIPTPLPPFLPFCCLLLCWKLSQKIFFLFKCRRYEIKMEDHLSIPSASGSRSFDGFRERKYFVFDVSCVWIWLPQHVTHGHWGLLYSCL